MRIRFTSKILPPYLRRTRSIEALLPWLYLKGISTGEFSEALAALLGPNAPRFRWLGKHGKMQKTRAALLPLCAL